MKKGQITFFIIIGLVILFTVILLMYFLKPTTTAQIGKATMQKTTTSEKSSIKLYVESCLKETLNDGLIELGENGGYLYRPKDIELEWTSKDIYSYLYIDRKDRMASMNLIISDLQKYINENIRYCIDDLAIYDEKGWDIKFPDIWKYFYPILSQLVTAYYWI